MRHIPDGVLRRLDDEPLAVPDRVGDHLETCERCRARHADIARDAERAARLLAAPPPASGADVAWARIRAELDRGAGEAGARVSTPSFSRRARVPRVPLRAALAMGAVAIVIAGTAAAATLTTIFAPTHVAAVPVRPGDLRAIATFTGLGGGHPLGGFATNHGSSRLPFGTVSWASRPAHPAGSQAEAAAEAGIPIPLPARLPGGVAAARQFVVQPTMTVTVTFNSSAASLAGKSVTIKAGPLVLAQYAGRDGSGVPPLAIAAMRRPTAQSSGASLSQIEAFLLAQPGIPPALAEEVRLLGDLRTTLPVPVPTGASVHSVQVGAWPGVLLADASNAASGLVWEDGRGVLHAVVGILSSQDVLHVARQIG